MTPADVMESFVLRLHGPDGVLRTSSASSGDTGDAADAASASDGAGETQLELKHITAAWCHLTFAGRGGDRRLDCYESLAAQNVTHGSVLKLRVKHLKLFALP